MHLYLQTQPEENIPAAGRSMLQARAFSPAFCFEQYCGIAWLQILRQVCVVCLCCSQNTLYELSLAEAGFKPSTDAEAHQQVQPSEARCMLDYRVETGGLSW